MGSGPAKATSTSRERPPWHIPSDPLACLDRKFIGKYPTEHRGDGAGQTEGVAKTPTQPHASGATAVTAQL